MDSLYIKEGQIKARNAIILHKDSKQIICPTHNMLIENGWQVYTSAETTIDEIKNLKIDEINMYDTSESVNSFILNENSVWLNKADRVGLMNSIQIEKAAGREISILWFEGIKLEIQCDQALQLLAALELYALECYNVTANHKANVMLLDNEEDISSYDYTVGYPEKLIINI